MGMDISNDMFWVEITSKYDFFPFGESVLLCYKGQYDKYISSKIIDDAEYGICVPTCESYDSIESFSHYMVITEPE